MGTLDGTDGPQTDQVDDKLPRHQLAVIHHPWFEHGHSLGIDLYLRRRIGCFAFRVQITSFTIFFSPFLSFRCKGRKDKTDCDVTCLFDFQSEKVKTTIFFGGGIN